MKFLAILLLSITFLTISGEAIGQEYVYFGNTNLVGTGARIEGKRNGSWKVYQRKEVEDNPRVANLEVPLDDLEQNFDLRVPFYRIDLRDNLPDGVMEEFFVGGQVKKIVNYIAGLLDGDFLNSMKKVSCCYQVTMNKGSAAEIG